MRIVSLFGLIFSLNTPAIEPDFWTVAMRTHWAWKPVKVHPIPLVKGEAWVINPVDRFILSDLEKVGLVPTTQASRVQLIRRVSFDLTGLPPTPSEIDSFLNDSSGNAWEKVIDRLLASPQYGVRWARHWLDLVRFAESNGFEFDEIRPDAWRYRDYVVDAFNQDKPYDRFILEQLAGDELFPLEPMALVATGFALLGPDMTDSSDQVRRRQNTLNDMLDTTCFTFLGLTMACARCHDHKFEPFSQRDYYSLQAFFAPARFRNDLNLLNPEKKKELVVAQKEFEAEYSPVKLEFNQIETPYRSRLTRNKLARQSPEVREAHETPIEKRTPAQRERVQETERFVGVTQAEIIKEMTPDERKRYKDLQERLKVIEGKRPRYPVAMGLQADGKNVARTYVLERGEPSQLGEEVKPGFPAVFQKNHGQPPGIQGSPGDRLFERGFPGGRAILGNWIASEENPLTARVMVNRLWDHHFGRGIVASPSDFGVRGERPTNPELLDWLAFEFIRGKWSLKKIHKIILLSATYQQSSVVPNEPLVKEPVQRHPGRMNRKRLEGEAIRDGMLAAAGILDLSLGGPSVSTGEIEPPKKVKISDRASPSENEPGQRKRSLYLFSRRNVRLPFLEAFDLPDSNLSCPKRGQSTTAPQALALLNSIEVAAASRAMSQRLNKEAGSVKDKVILGYRLALGRMPKEGELVIALEFLKESPLEEFCRALFNINEFVYVD